MEVDSSFSDEMKVGESVLKVVEGFSTFHDDTVSVRVVDDILAKVNVAEVVNEIGGGYNDHLDLLAMSDHPTSSLLCKVPLLAVVTVNGEKSGEDEGSGILLGESQL